MGIYRNWVEKKEWEGFKIHAPQKSLHEFEWGLEHIGLSGRPEDPRSLIRTYVKDNIENSEKYFVPPKIPSDKFDLEGNILTFESTIASEDIDNNKVHARFFPTSDTENAV